jgi:hypothetical protein|tara:strand:+ start:471 stop:839 length:369 start_codon:yes stop_codon:yes gene_type:complete
MIKNTLKQEYQYILSMLDSKLAQATTIYSKILNNTSMWEADKKFAEELLNKAFMLCESIQGDRFEIQSQIIRQTMDNSEETQSVYESGLMSEQDYNEYNYNRDVDSQADEMDALSSIGWGEE